MTLRSGRVVGKWHIAQAKIRHNKSIVGDNIKFRFTDPPDPRLKPMSDVFNIPELLDQILNNMRPGALLENAQLVCRGFKETIARSPTFRKRAAFAIHVHDCYYKEKRGVEFSYGLMPRFPHQRERGNFGRKPFVFRFYFSDDTRLLGNYRTMERFRALRVFDRVPQRFWVKWHYPHVAEFWNVEADGDAVTFGEIFDVVSGLVPDNTAVETMEFTWLASTDEWDSEESLYD